MNIPAADDFEAIAKRIKEIAQERAPTDAQPETPKPADTSDEGFVYYGDGGVYW